MAETDKYFKRYSITSPSYMVNKIAGEAIRDRASKYFKGRMLEIGCGTKIKHLLVGDFIEEHIGLDHEDCPHDHSNIDMFGTAYNIPAADDSFDCILSTAVLEHLEEPQKALEEAFRVLKPGGFALYTMPLYWHLHEEPRDFFRYTKHGLQFLFERGGFEIIEITPLSGFITTFAAQLNYYLKRLNIKYLSPIISGIIGINNILVPKLDRGFLRDEKFTWMYLVMVEKPPSANLPDDHRSQY